MGFKNYLKLLIGFFASFAQQMKEILRKISSVAMAFVVLLSTLSFTVEAHYCGDTLVDSSLFSAAESCGMEMEAEPQLEGCAVSMKDCCSDEQLVLDGQKDLKSSSDKLTQEQKVFLYSYIYTYVDLFEGLDENPHAYLDYRPPLVTRQIYKLDESYLI